ncbi:hypothetical protein LCGC14_2847640 [marine sediment metagenome]|uniref:Uncharacterized protein n=1 Tax=marine sediment metagenome TaxID=412755 RepID=A0A0F9B0C2_9ZZZZ
MKTYKVYGEQINRFFTTVQAENIKDALDKASCVGPEKWEDCDLITDLEIVSINEENK